MRAAVRSSRRQAREHAAHWARPQSGAFTYVALGDSAGVGVGVDDPDRGYVGIVAQRLAESTGHTVRTVNLAVSGARARDVLDAQLPELSAMDPPDAVTCVVGGNDVAWAPFFRAGRFAATMYAIAERLPEGAVMGLVPRFAHWPYEGRARTANRIIRAAARESSHAVADIHAATRRLTLPAYLRTFAPDRFHPGEAGHRIWAETIWEALTSR